MKAISKSYLKRSFSTWNEAKIRWLERGKIAFHECKPPFLSENNHQPQTYMLETPRFPFSCEGITSCLWFALNDSQIKYQIFCWVQMGKKKQQNKFTSKFWQEVSLNSLFCSCSDFGVSTGNVIITQCPLTNIMGAESIGSNVPFRKGSAQFHYFHTCREQLQFSL